MHRPGHGMLLAGLVLAGAQAPAVKKSIAPPKRIFSAPGIDHLTPIPGGGLVFLSNVDWGNMDHALLNVARGGAAVTAAEDVYQYVFNGIADYSRAAFWDEEPLRHRNESPGYQVSPDGRVALYQTGATACPPFSLRAVDLTTHLWIPIANHVSPLDGYGFSPDGADIFAVQTTATSGDVTAYRTDADGTLWLAHRDRPGKTLLLDGIRPDRLWFTPHHRAVYFEGCPNGEMQDCKFGVGPGHGAPPRWVADDIDRPYWSVVFNEDETMALVHSGGFKATGALQLVDVGGGTPRLLASDALPRESVFSPDGKAVAFLTGPSADVPYVHGGISVAWVDGGKVLHLPIEARGGLHFSSDGRTLYALTPQGRSTGRLVALSLPDGGERLVSKRVTGIRDAGAKLLFLSDFDQGTGTLEILDAAGTLHRLGDAVAGSYRFSEDGTTVLWAAASVPIPETWHGISSVAQIDATPRGGLRVFAASGPLWRPRQLASGNLAEKYWPSPDGSSVLVTEQEARTGIFAMKARPRLVSPSGAWVLDGESDLWAMPDEPAFSPDGRILAVFVSGVERKRSGRLEIRSTEDGALIAELDRAKTFSWSTSHDLYIVRDDPDATAEAGLYWLPLP